MLYAVVCQVEYETVDSQGVTWSGTQGVGVFYLEALSAEDAERRAHGIVEPLGRAVSGRVRSVHADASPAHTETIERFLRDAKSSGCSCGMADYGTPGHDGS